VSDLTASIRLLTEAEALGYAGPDIDRLRRLVKSVTHCKDLWDNGRAYAAIVVSHRLVRQRLERHRELCEGAL
jgi:hypothetical protein